MAHGVHPNYSEVHSDSHKVAVNGGIVIKVNSNQRYATDAVSSAIVNAIAKSDHIPVQYFIAKNDMGCGSTVGPVVAA